MDETHEQHKLHGFMQCLIYVSIGLEIAEFVYIHAPFWGVFSHALLKLQSIAIYRELVYSKLATLFKVTFKSGRGRGVQGD